MPYGRYFRGPYNRGRTEITWAAISTRTSLPKEELTYYRSSRLSDSKGNVMECSFNFARFRRQERQRPL